MNDEIRSFADQARIALRCAVSQSGPMRMAARLALGFRRNGQHVAISDNQFHVHAPSADPPREGAHPFSAFTMSACKLRPVSGGRIGLRLRDYPKIHPNHLTTDTDRRSTAIGVRIAMDIAKHDSQ